VPAKSKYYAAVQRERSPLELQVQAAISVSKSLSAELGLIPVLFCAHQFLLAYNEALLASQRRVIFRIGGMTLLAARRGSLACMEFLSEQRKTRTHRVGPYSEHLVLHRPSQTSSPMSFIGRSESNCSIPVVNVSARTRVRIQARLIVLSGDVTASFVIRFGSVST